MRLFTIQLTFSYLLGTTALSNDDQDRDPLADLKSCNVGDIVACKIGQQKCVPCDVVSDGTIDKVCVSYKTANRDLCNLKKFPGCKCGEGVYQQFGPWVSAARVLLDPSSNPSCFENTDCQNRNLGQKCAICKFGNRDASLCSDNRSGQEDKFWCGDPRCECDKKTASATEDPTQLVAIWEHPPPNDNELQLNSGGFSNIGHSLVAGQDPSYKQQVGDEFMIGGNEHWADQGAGDSKYNAQASNDGGPFI